MANASLDPDGNGLRHVAGAVHHHTDRICRLGIDVQIVPAAERRRELGILIPIEGFLASSEDNGALQCAIVLGGGEEAFNRNEDAQFASSFRGRNNLDIYSQTADSVSVMVNRTSDVAQTIPIWIKAGIGQCQP